MEEIWKDIEGFNGTYQVSSSGRVRSLNRIIDRKNQWGWHKKKIKGQLIKPVIHKNGYCRVDLKGRLYSIHRLVAMAFIINAKKSPQVNHINGVKHDNRVENLEWATHSENVRHADRMGLRNMPKGKDHYSYGKIGSRRKVVIDAESGIIYNSLKEAAVASGIKYKYLSLILCGKCRNKTKLKYL